MFRRNASERKAAAMKGSRSSRAAAAAPAPAPVAPPKPTKPTVAFIHGLWLHGESWKAWQDFFASKGYENTMVLKWPGDGATVAETDADAMGGVTIAAVLEYLIDQVKDMSPKPIVVGHSMGGLLAQMLLSSSSGESYASAAISICGAPIAGASGPFPPMSVVRSTWPAVSNPFNEGKAVTISQSHFAFAMASEVESEEEIKELYEKYVIPAPAKPIFELARAPIQCGAAPNTVTMSPTRGPLLLIAAEKDNTVPVAFVEGTKKVYDSKTTPAGEGEEAAPVVTDYKLFEGRGHSITIDAGWEEVAQYSVEWLEK